MISSGCIRWIKKRTSTRWPRAQSRPTPQEVSTCNPVHPQTEGTHSQVALMKFTHCLDFMKGTPHVPVKLGVHFLFFALESMNVLQYREREKEPLNIYLNMSAYERIIKQYQVQTSIRKQYFIILWRMTK